MDLSRFSITCSEAWHSGRIDKIIKNFTYLLSHTLAWNTIHYPAGIVPVSVVGESELDFKDDINDAMTKNTVKSLK